MSWYPTETQGREPGLVVKTYRKMSAFVRWVLLVVIAGLALAVLIGVGVSALVTAIENGL